MTYTPDQSDRTRRYDFASYLQDLPKPPAPKPGLWSRARQSLLERGFQQHGTKLAYAAAATGLVLGALAEADYFIHTVYSPSFVLLSAGPAFLYTAGLFLKRLAVSFKPRSLLLAGADLFHTACAYPLQIARNVLILTAVGLAAATMTQNVLHPLPTQKPRMLRMMETATRQAPPASVQMPVTVFPAHGVPSAQPTEQTVAVPPPPVKTYKPRVAKRPPIELGVPRPFVPNDAYLGYK